MNVASYRFANPNGPNPRRNLHTKYPQLHRAVPKVPVARFFRWNK